MRIVFGTAFGKGTDGARDLAIGFVLGSDLPRLADFARREAGFNTMGLGAVAGVRKTICQFAASVA